MRNIITLHSNSSSGIGGLESFLRHIFTLTTNENQKTIEIFGEFGTGSHFDIPKNVESIMIGNYAKTITRLFFWRAKISKITNNYQNSIIIIFHPKHLIYFNKKTIKNNKIILVQSTKFEVLFKSRMSKLIFNIYKKNIDLISVYSNLDKEIFKNIFPHEKIEIIPRGCKIETASQPPRLSKKLVTIARISEKDKNLLEMIDIVKGLESGYSLDIYGDGDKTEINKLNEKIKNKKNIKYMGITKDVKSTLSKYSLFLMTSHYEGFGQTIIEARSQGLPVVAYNTFDSAPWVIKDNKTGILIKPYDIESFRKAINHITSNHKIYNFFAKNSIYYSKETEKKIIDEKWKNILQS